MNNQVALIVRHRTKPGQRDAMRAVWERYIKPNVSQNPGHLAYYFNTVEDDPDGVVAFQIFTDHAAKDAFLASDWYPEYLEEVSPHIAEPPEITTASVAWSKQDPS